MRIAYDLDGTLARTRQAVLAAYRDAGIEPPPDFFGKPWREWLSDPEIHRRKNEIYRNIASSLITPAPILEIYRATGGAIITGASEEAAYITLRTIGIEPNKILGSLYCGMSMRGKAEVLNSIDEEGIMFEDSFKIASYLKENTRWQICLVL